MKPPLIELQRLTRSAAESRLTGLIELDTACFGRDAAWNAQQFLAELPQKWQLSWLASNGDRIAGFVIASRYALHAAHISRLAVRPDCRGSGVGRNLVLAVESQVPGRQCDIVTLEFDEQLQLDEFYGSLGFEPLNSELVLHYLLLKDKVASRNLYVPVETAPRKVFAKRTGRHGGEPVLSSGAACM